MTCKALTAAALPSPPSPSSPCSSTLGYMITHFGKEKALPLHLPLGAAKTWSVRPIITALLWQNCCHAEFAMLMWLRGAAACPPPHTSTPTHPHPLRVRSTEVVSSVGCSERLNSARHTFWGEPVNIRACWGGGVWGGGVRVAVKIDHSGFLL